MQSKYRDANRIRLIKKSHIARSLCPMKSLDKRESRRLLGQHLLNCLKSISCLAQGLKNIRFLTLDYCKHLMNFNLILITI